MTFKFQPEQFKDLKGSDDETEQQVIAARANGLLQSYLDECPLVYGTLNPDSFTTHRSQDDTHRAYLFGIEPAHECAPDTRDGLAYAQATCKVCNANIRPTRWERA